MKCWRTYTVEDGVELEFEYYFDPREGEDEGRVWTSDDAAVCSHQTVDVLGEVIVTSYDPHGDVFAVPCRGNGSNEEREADEKVSLLKQRHSR